MALTELQQIITEAEQMRPPREWVADVSQCAFEDRLLDLIIRLAREVDDVLRTATYLAAYRVVAEGPINPGPGSEDLQDAAQAFLRGPTTDTP